MDFANVSENGSADFNVVAKVNLKPFKDEMNDFRSRFQKVRAGRTLRVFNRESGKDRR